MSRQSMSIQEIKAALSIDRVLGYYGLAANSRGMLCCPFHKDRKASMKVYQKTNTVYCFAGGCVGSLDTIDFIWKKEGGSKHEAIVKAKSLCDEAFIKTMSEPTPTTPNLTKQYPNYQASLKRSPKAKAYCEGRCLEWEQLALGYKSQKTSEKWGRGCIIFPLRNERDEVISLYGRSIVNGNHYYSSGRSGLYPGYPKAETKRLILTECIIDAASIWQQEVIIKDHSILALYGTNGLTKEHLFAIQSLKQLEEITFFLDGDEAGQQAVKQYAEQLSALLPKVRLMNIMPLENEDINSILQAHDPAILVDMIANRRQIPSTKEKITSTKIQIPTLKIQSSNSALNTHHPHNLIYTTHQATYYIKGGIRYGAKDYEHSTHKTNARTLNLVPQQILLFQEYLTITRPQLLKTPTEKLLLTKRGTEEKGEGIHYLCETYRHLFPTKRLTPTTIRQSVIANLLKQGKDLRVVQVFAGHKKVSATERYRQNNLEVLQQAIQKFHPLKE